MAETLRRPLFFELFLGSFLPLSLFLNTNPAYIDFDTGMFKIFFVPAKFQPPTPKLTENVSETSLLGSISTTAEMIGAKGLKIP